MKILEGKVAIITGSSRGIGRVVAEQLADLGAKVVINYSSNRQKADEVVAGILKKGRKAVALHADLSKLSDVKELFTKTIEAFGKVDILINNAGLMITKPLSDVTEDDFDKQFAVNVKGTFFACQQALQHMENNGRIVNFSTSVAGQMFPTYSVYAGTKGAVAPGPVNTELFKLGKTEQQIDAMKKMNAFGRIGEPEDIANVIEFLVSDKSQWVTGQTLRVNGGFI